MDIESFVTFVLFVVNDSVRKSLHSGNLYESTE